MKIKIIILISILLNSSYQVDLNIDDELSKSIKNLKKSRSIGFTPIIETEFLYSNELLCDSGSLFDSLQSSGTTRALMTCNGLTIDEKDISFNAFIGRDKKRRVRLTVGNYTGTSLFSNGNRNFQENGIITGGKCDGDRFSGTTIFRAADQLGCSNPGGVRNGYAVYSVRSISGVCSSACEAHNTQIGFSYYLSSKSVNNWGPGAGRPYDSSDEEFIKIAENENSF